MENSLAFLLAAPFIFFRQARSPDAVWLYFEALLFLILPDLMLPKDVVHFWAILASERFRSDLKARQQQPGQRLHCPCD